MCRTLNPFQSVADHVEAAGHLARQRQHGGTVGTGQGTRTDDQHGVLGPAQHLAEAVPALEQVAQRLPAGTQILDRDGKSTAAPIRPIRKPP